MKTTRIRLSALGLAPAEGKKKVKVSEKVFQQSVIDLAHDHGYRVAHCRKVRVSRGDRGTYWETPMGADGVGFFDLVLIGDRVIFAELKTDTGSTTLEQRIWIDSAKLAGAEVYTWRPRDWESIVECLQKTTEKPSVSGN